MRKTTTPPPTARKVTLGLAFVGALGAAACGAAPRMSSSPSAPEHDASTPPPASAASSAAPAGLAYPKTPKGDVHETLHGVVVADPYRWLEDVKSPDVQAWMTAQDDLARRALGELPARARLIEKLTALAYTPAMGEPFRRGARYFVARREGTQEKFLYTVREAKAKNGNEKERVILDPNAFSADGSVSLHAVSVSWDGTKIAYGKSVNNADAATIYVRDVATGKDSPIDVIEGGRYAYPSWTAKGDGFYYVKLPTDPAIPADALPGYQEVRFHALGTDPRGDVVLKEHLGDPSRFFSVWASKNGHWLFHAIARGWTQVDVFFQDLREKEPRAWKPLAVGVEAIFDVREHADRFFVRTNEGASRYRLFAVDPKKLERAAWREIVAERPDATLQGVNIVGGHLVLGYTKDVVSELEVRALDGKLVRNVALPGPGAASVFSGDADDDEAFYTFQSYTTPPEIYATRVKSGKTTLFDRREVAMDTSSYMVEARFATSKDGTRVPYFVMRAKAFAKTGKTPTLLAGYGGFAVNEKPLFGALRLGWLAEGGIYVSAALRGGEEYGKAWHEAGMRHAKQNVFDDFYAVAEDLIREGYTSPAHLGIRGGSNGGLLVGAAMTQRPELFGAIVCAVPLLDMIRYTKFGAGKTWRDEYGNPEDAADFRALLAYSPYHHVQSGIKYPPLLLLSADSDDRVDPFHARKFAAAMQASSTGGPVLLRIERNAGHGGADLVKKTVEQTADTYAFLLAHLR